MTDDKKASLNELKHAGVKGMRWRVKKDPLPPPPREPTPSIPVQKTHVLRWNFGFALTRAVLQKYGSKTLLPLMPKPAPKEDVRPLKNSNRVTKGSAVTLRILGTTAKVTNKTVKSLAKRPTKVPNKPTKFPVVRDSDKAPNESTKLSPVNRLSKVTNKTAR